MTIAETLNDKADISPYEKLANAIILQAVEDYRDDEGVLAKKLFLSGKRIGAYVSVYERRWFTREEVERFIRSPWFGVLTEIEPEYLIEMLAKEER